MRQTWAQSGNSRPEATPPQRPKTWPNPQASLTDGTFDAASKDDQDRDHYTSVFDGGSSADNSSSHVRRILRRPHSAPSPAYGRPDAHESRKYGRSCMRHQPAHQRCASADPAQSLASELEGSDMQRLAAGDIAEDDAGVHSGAGSHSIRQVRSASPPILEDRSYED